MLKLKLTLITNADTNTSSDANADTRRALIMLCPPSLRARSLLPPPSPRGGGADEHEVADGIIGPPDPTPRNVLNWCF